MSIPKTLLAAAALATCLALPGPSASAGDTKAAPASKTGIQWYASWEQAQAEAKRTQRPILLTSAAPHCRNISGMW
ncbi:MAG: hypothetical protein P1V36_16270 [Planctomycetota bacterium]|nr:hypothetical protein [Planctomycetota bacterium]